MYCSNCGATVREDASFCEKCGKPLSTERSVYAEQIRSPVVWSREELTGGNSLALSSAHQTNTLSVYGGLYRRLGAYTVDQLLLTVGLFLIGFSVGAVGHWTLSEYSSFWLGSIVALVYFQTMESSPWQATLGKKLFGIKVTDMDGERLTHSRSLSRQFKRTLDVATLGFGILRATWSPNRQTFHDKFSKTLVLRWDVTPEELAAAPAAPASRSTMIVGLSLAVTYVVGMLAAIGLPAYQNYVLRSQVTEAYQSLNNARVIVSEAIAHGLRGARLSQPTIAVSSASASPYVEEVIVESGAIAVVFGKAANSKIAGRLLVVTPGVASDGSIVWTCGAQLPAPGVTLTNVLAVKYTDVPVEYLPSACR